MIAKLSRNIGLFFSKLAPGWSNSRIDAALYSPESSDKTGRIPRGFEEIELKSKDGVINAYKNGKGPVVVFVHGWGGSASQFFPLMRGLARCGFTGLAFDHQGHGKSKVRQATLQQFITTTNFVLHHVANHNSDGLFSVVGHSTGCIAIANCRNSLLKDLPLFLISPIFNFRLFFLKKLVQLNLHPDLLKQYANGFAKVYKREFGKLELARSLDKYGDVTVIAHDTNDTESSISETYKFCKRFPLTKLLVTREFDHERIIHSESVWQELKSHLNYEDTTINFGQDILASKTIVTEISQLPATY